MNFTHQSLLVRRSTAAALLAGAAVLLGACSTVPVASREQPSEKPDRPVAYSELHQMMVKLAAEPVLWNDVRPGESLPPPASDVGASGTLASNPP
jgi:hypothetical protein